MTRLHDVAHSFLTARRGDILEDVALATLLAVVILLVSRLPRVPARTRHALLVVALAKFVVPVWAVGALLSAVGARMPQPLQRVSEAAGEGTIWIGFATGTGGGASHVACAVAGVWLLGALLLVALQLRAHSRAKGIARRARAADSEATAILASVKVRMNCRDRVRLVLSDDVATPCVVRQNGIVLILPATVGYEPAELEAVFAHELAHVTRGDLGVRLVVGFVAALHWPNPVAWIVRRRIHVEAESACDVEAIAVTQSVDRYLDAIRKSILPGGREHAVAGMMGSGLAERLRRMPMWTKGSGVWNHRVALSLCVALVAAVTVIAAAPPAEQKRAAAPGALVTDGSLLSIASGDIGRYGVFVNVRGIRQGQLLVNVAVKDKESGALVSAPRVVTQPHQPATVRSGFSTPDGKSAEMVAEIIVDADGNGSVALAWIESGLTVERGTVELRAGSEVAASYDFLRKPFKLSLKDAKIHDVLNMFSQLTGFEVQMSAGLRHDVTIELHDVPFEEALDQVLEQAGADWYLDGKTIVVVKAR